MRWVTYRSAGARARVGIVVDGVVHGLDSDVTLLGLLEAGPEAMESAAAAARTRPLESKLVSEAEFCLPFRPPSIRDCGGFLQHMRNNRRLTGRDVDGDERFAQYPPFCFGNSSAAIGDGADVRIPPNCHEFDYELEIAAVIGAPGADIPLAKARDHIAGFMIFCDWSARDLQMAERGLFGGAKGKDCANSLGPALVTPDELEEYRSDRGYALQMTATVNGVQTTNGRWDQVDWDFDDMICYTSRGVVLMPGDVIGSGTVPSGCLMESYSLDPDNFRGYLAGGDEVVMAVEQLGQLRHRILPADPAQPLSSGY